MSASEKIGVIGLWHLGCVIAASWSSLGKNVAAMDFDAELIADLSKGNPPLFEPGLAETINEGLVRGTLSFSTDPASVSDCGVVFIAYDTPVRDDDSCDLSPIEKAISAITGKLQKGAIVVVSSQLPVGTAQLLRRQLQDADPSVELIYSPENLRLGEAIACYKQPGHIVLGAESEEAGRKIEALFAPMQAQCLHMSLPSSEMAKHGINSFLAMCITFANQMADLCDETGADFSAVARALKHDPRIGQRAYLSAGIGFSGGTLGRDLRILGDLNAKTGAGGPLFADAWQYNLDRAKVVERRAAKLLGGLKGKTITLLGMTYKPGTSTLRRSLPLTVACLLIDAGVTIRAHDPKADWSETALPPAPGFTVVQDLYAACDGADMVVLLTEWPQFREIDFAALKTHMTGRHFFDTKNFLSAQYDAMACAGLSAVGIGRGDLA